MQAINFYIIYIFILILAEFIWTFYITFLLLKIFKENETLFKKQFFVFIGGAAVVGLIVNRLFEYAISEIDVVSGIWDKLGGMERIGLLLVPSFIIMYAYFYLASLTLKLKGRELLIFILILGAANSPWRILL